MFYEFKHPLSADYFSKECGTDHSFPSHLHHCFELITVTHGKMVVTIDNREYLLSPGECALVFPNQIHSLSTSGHSSHILCLFSSNLVSAYAKIVSSQVPIDNKFKPSDFYVNSIKNISEKCSKIALKGFLYSICGEFDAQAEYRDSGSAPKNLLHTIFRFIDSNYTENCSLSELSKHSGYEYTYLSHYFKSVVGIPFNEYVNQYRISRACYLITNTDMTILEVANECGFNSLRSFNRQFKKQLNSTPVEYRRAMCEKSLARESLQ